MATTSTALAAKNTIADALDKMKPQLKMALPRGMDADHFIRTVVTLVQKTPGLRDCSPNSILLGVSQCAEIGLELGTFLGHAYLVPYKGTAQLQIGWRGFIELARRSGLIRGISAEVVYQRDEFKIVKGLEPKLEHVPALSDRGRPIGAYAIATFKDGFKDFEWMDLEQIEHCRKSSRATRDDSPWNTHWEEMARKTPIRRLCKRLPLSPEDAALIRAAVLDEYHEAEVEEAPAGILELEQDSPLLPPASPKSEAPAAEAPPTPEAAKSELRTDEVYYHVGKMLTTVTGATYAIKDDFKKLGGRYEKDKKAWTIPASLTADLVKLLNNKKIKHVEIDDKGQVMQSYQATDEDLPQSMFPEEGGEKF